MYGQAGLYAALSFQVALQIAEAGVRQPAEFYYQDLASIVLESG